MSILVFGDSISCITHGEGGYIKTLEKTFSPIKVHNFAISGSGLSTGTPNSCLKVVKALGCQSDVNYSLCLIWHATNDWYWGTPLGDPLCADETTFFGSIDLLVKKLRSFSPLGLMVWVAPIYRWEQPFETSREGNAFLIDNKVGLTLADYAGALEYASKIYGFPVVPMHELTQFHEGNADHFFEDGVHPNRAGYDRIEKSLIPYLKQYKSILEL
ncbi:MAG: SGNH/GDSL hydrolase family protein [Sphaerochaeta sp.]|nr:SGNH/GDSL hydrolase family protein [Sphaerochaeta sp.]